MKYLTLVKKNSRQLGRFLKAATDIANMLDGDLFQVSGKESYERQSKSENRETIFNCLCAIFTETGLPVPPLEPCLYLPHCESRANDIEADRAAKVVEHVRTQINGDQSQNAAACGAIVSIIGLFPGAMAWNGIRPKEIVCKLNELLVASGKDPIRPDYAATSVKLLAHDAVAVPPKASVLVVDDDRREIGRTMLALAGWENISLDAFLHLRDGGDDKKDERMAAVAHAIVERKPDIVLMDEGLDRDFKGSDLIPVIEAAQKKAHPKKRIVFLANTGGPDDELRQKGALRNFAKGERRESFEVALDCLPITRK